MATTAQLAKSGRVFQAIRPQIMGSPFGEIFTRYNHDFYRIDPMLFSPGFVVFVNVDTGKRHEFGRLAPDVLAESFAKK